MTLIVLVIAFAIELLWERVQRWRSDRWFEDFSRSIAARFEGQSIWNGPAGVAAVLALPVLAVALLQSLLQGDWLGLLALLFGLAALLYSLRYQPLERALDRCCDALESGDRDSARQAAEELGASVGEEDAADVLSTAVLLQSHHRLFAVVFWFAILGAVGAVLYRLTWVLAQRRADEEETEPQMFRATARHLLAILDWVPIRLLALSYALAGSFDEALHEWGAAPAADNDLFDANYELLQGVALGALRPERYQDEDESMFQVPGRVDVSVVRAARSLVMRSAMLWGIVVALFTLGGMAY